MSPLHRTSRLQCRKEGLVLGTVAEISPLSRKQWKGKLWTLRSKAFYGMHNTMMKLHFAQRKQFHSVAVFLFNIELHKKYNTANGNTQGWKNYSNMTKEGLWSGWWDISMKWPPASSHLQVSSWKVLESLRHKPTTQRQCALLNTPQFFVLCPILNINRLYSSEKCPSANPQVTITTLSPSTFLKSTTFTPCVSWRY